MGRKIEDKAEIREVMRASMREGKMLAQVRLRRGAVFGGVEQRGGMIIEGCTVTGASKDEVKDEYAFQTNHGTIAEPDIEFVEEIGR